MIIQASDGKFYRDPVWYTDKAVVWVDAEVLTLSRVGGVGWRTAVKELTALGIRARCVKGPESGSAIFLRDGDENGRLMSCVHFQIALISIPPTPSQSKLILESAPPLMDDEPIIRFKKRRNRGKVERRPELGDNQ